MINVNSFQPGQMVMYPVHGLGHIVSKETQLIGDHNINVIVIQFLGCKARITIPTIKAQQNGLRPVAGKEAFNQALMILKTKQVIQKSKLIWTKRYAMYENKFKSGDILLIAELVRDLHSILQQSFPSHSEQNLYKLAIGQLAQEMAIIQQKEPADTLRTLEEILKAA